MIIEQHLLSAFCVSGTILNTYNINPVNCCNSPIRQVLISLPILQMRKQTQRGKKDHTTCEWWGEDWKLPLPLRPVTQCAAFFTWRRVRQMGKERRKVCDTSCFSNTTNDCLTAQANDRFLVLLTLDSPGAVSLPVSWSWAGVTSYQVTLPKEGVFFFLGCSLLPFIL